jgi:SAM-dependent methyltransferase
MSASASSPSGRLRTRLRLRQRWRSPVAIKHDEELAWWVDHWNPPLVDPGLVPADDLELLGGEAPAPAYAGRRRQIARAAVLRVLREAGIHDHTFFDNKVVVDVGPGALGFPDACPARVSIGVEPLAHRFAAAGLLLADSRALYLAARAEAIPLLSGSVDVVVARNSLDHVDDPEAAVAEARRLLRPGGTLILNFDVDHTPTPTEPHALDADVVRSWLRPMTIVRDAAWPHSHGRDGHAVVLVARQTVAAAGASAATRAGTRSAAAARRSGPGQR